MDALFNRFIDQNTVPAIIVISFCDYLIVLMARDFNVIAEL